ncbi:hypothetical protein D9Q98_001217 [Chlorella vulgaris]|uniref:Uncharacterized protein n=1 Tax=Chlorella vulgaris TaxID=3077 RepID=A0A9D4U011_CHLVU|nr:hypothetical protein D9Q98_001215 [Chlorella vulgaris]KAI3438800.1 hypothetical protein D9Q98_001217 [Chlorella vulgaris]
MPGFADVRETMFARLKKIDPTLRERIPKLKVSEADKDALQQNYAHYRHWLTENVKRELLVLDTSSYLYDYVTWSSLIGAAVVAERTADHARRWSKRL